MITNQIRGTSDLFRALRLASPKASPTVAQSRRPAGAASIRSVAASAPRDHAAGEMRTAQCQVGYPCSSTGLEVVVKRPGGELPGQVPGCDVRGAEVEPVPHPGVDDILE